MVRPRGVSVAQRDQNRNVFVRKVSVSGGMRTTATWPSGFVHTGIGSREPNASRAQLARMLGLEERDVGERPLWVKAGKEQ